MDDTLFDRSRLTLLPLGERRHDLDVSVVADPVPPADIHPAFRAVAARLDKARGKGAARILMMGAHVLRSGMQRYLIDLMREGFVSLVAVNGACAIHDFELALIGATTESVARYITDGRFGLWRETGRINDVVNEGAAAGKGIGEALGGHILEGDFPHKDISVFAQARAIGVPVTVHAGIGYDIVHEHPNCDGAAWGRSSYLDFLRYARSVQDLQGGAVMNFGSAVMAPEVFLKALAMARNAASAKGMAIDDFATLVCDLAELPDSFRIEAKQSDPRYYFRPWKTMLVRSVSGSGESHYVRGQHADTVPQLWAACMERGSAGA